MFSTIDHIRILSIDGIYEIHVTDLIAIHRVCVEVAVARLTTF